METDDGALSDDEKLEAFLSKTLELSSTLAPLPVPMPSRIELENVLKDVNWMTQEYASQGKAVIEKVVAPLAMPADFAKGKPRGFSTQDLDKCLEMVKRGELLPPHTIKFICKKASELLLKESNVREIAAPVTIVGDIHGQFYDLLEMLKITGEAPETNFLFLGDFVDRGYYSVEVISYLLCLKVRYPDRVTLIRGNHESRRTTMTYGFYQECMTKYQDPKVWQYLTDLFDFMPLAALVNGEIFATHGGLSPLMHTLDQIRVINRFQEIPYEGLICDLMWSDPEADLEGFAVSTRGASFVFGEDVADRFMQINNLSFLFRAHQLCQEGYQVLWGKLATVWSAPNYCYRMGNLAAVCELDQNLSRHFNVFDAAPASARPPPPSRTDPKPNVKPSADNRKYFF